ncbi:ERAD-associated protein [Coemansia sp. RSA 552]|nr:ERAD-associated protein [Coemansia sp. RSA 552]
MRSYVLGAGRIISRVFGLGVDSRWYSKRQMQPKTVRQAIQVMRELADNGHEDASLVLAEMAMYGRYGTDVDPGSAFEQFQLLAEDSGNAVAQYMLGLFYATGMGGVEQQNSLALLYTTLSAIQGHTPAEASLAFKYLSGIGVPVSCDKALSYYQSVAHKAIRYYQSGPVLGRHMPDYRVRLSDDNGGVYGVRTGPYSLYKAVNRKSFDEILSYHQQNAQKGDVKACMTLVDLYYHGHRYMPRNFGSALKYLRNAQEQLFTGQGELSKGLTQGEVNAAAQAAGLYGIMALRGEGIPVDTVAARKWLDIGAKMGNGISLNALGVMYQKGIEVPENRERAIELFKLAAERRQPGGQVNYALAIMDVMPDVAHKNLKRAAENGHLLAHFHLGELYAGMASTEIQCRMAVASYKYVSENGDWLHSPMPAGLAAYQRGDLGSAAVEYMQAAEMGYSVGQLNAALLLDVLARRTGGLDERPGDASSGDGVHDGGDGESSTKQTPSAWTLFGSRAAHARQTLAYWTRAANQNMPDARVKQGDHYFYGWGVERSAEKAAAAYTIAAEVDANGLAMWNLGWMYENGVGVPRDFYLAKRWYDKSMEVNEGGGLANRMSLLRLCIKYMWAHVRGEDVGTTPLFQAPKPITQEEEEVAKAEAMGAGKPDVQAPHLDPYGGGDEFAPDDWEHGAGTIDADDLGVDGEDEDEDDETLSGNLFFIMLFLAAACMFIQFR